MQNNAHPLDKKKVIFVGRLLSCSKREVVAKLELAGGIYRDKLNGLTDIVVVGDREDMPGSEPNVLLAARELEKAGKLIIMCEREFAALL